MATEVRTITTCDICGMFDTRNRAERAFPPEHWGELVLTIRLQGSGWTNNERTEATLCPECIRQALAFMKK